MRHTSCTRQSSTDALCPEYACRYPGEAGYVDADSITFPWVVNKKDLPPEEVKILEARVEDTCGVQS